ncbi:MAG: hypothetical protein J3K34DRAFT_406796 [Monoraphidium minutum]|nr:MAG: hypothetical protein J3K34DRAFT_406796 [Monoraphidium minutum]
MRVPPTFLATSHEWDRISDYAHNLEAFTEIFKVFGPSPILRMGGASQDKMKAAPKKETWLAMAAMHRSFNARFIIGLPLWHPESVHMAREMMVMAETLLPPEALIGFELGNEPEFWPNSVGGYEPSANSTFIPGFDAYANYFARTATALNPCGAGNKPKLAGPGWGNVNTIDATWLVQQAKAPGARCYMRELSIHYYPYVNNVTIDARGLLDQGLQDYGLDKFKWLNGVSKGVGLPMRISETNSLYGGGRAGLSDTVAGTMWCADALFAFASAGAEAFHFHWGFGGQPKHGGQPNTGVQTNFWDDSLVPYPSVHAPWYGYLLFRFATAGPAGGFSDTTLVRVDTNRAGCNANVKVWGLAPDGGGLRVALLNKDLYENCNVAVSVEAQHCGFAGRRGALHRLMPGAKGMESKDGLTWRGQTYDSSSSGKLLGETVATEVLPEIADFWSGRCKYVVAMPAASGAVLEIVAV